MSERYTFNELREQFEHELHNKNMPKTLYKSIENIIRIINAIVKTNGNGWAAQVVDNKGNQVLTTEEQKKFTEAFEPYTDSIIGFFTKKMRGGVCPDPNSPDVDDPECSKYFEEETKKEQQKFSALKARKALKNAKAAPGKTAAAIVGESPYKQLLENPAKISKNIIDKIREYDDKVNDLIGTDVLKIQGSIHSIPDKSPIPPIGSLVTLSQQTQIVSPRLIMFIVYLLLDIARIGINSTGSITGRKIFSILVAILDVLRDSGKYKWQKAFLSLIGYVGSNQLLIGELLKIFLSLFEKLNPTFQTNFIDGIPGMVKSIMTGIVLETLSITATKNVGEILDYMFQQISMEKDRIDGVIGRIPVGPRSDDLSPSFKNINNLQAVITDPAYRDSCEIRNHIFNFISEVGEEGELPVKFILFMFDMPIEFKVPIIKEEFEEQFNEKHGLCGQFQKTMNEQINDLRKQEAQGQPVAQVASGAQVQEKKEEKDAPGAQGQPVAQVAPGAQGQPVAQVAPGAQVQEKKEEKDAQGQSGGRIHRSRRLLHQRGSE